MQAVEISVVVKVVSMMDIWFISSPGHLAEIYTSDTTPLVPQGGIVEHRVVGYDLTHIRSVMLKIKSHYISLYIEMDLKHAAEIQSLSLLLL